MSVTHSCSCFIYSPLSSYLLSTLVLFTLHSRLIYSPLSSWVKSNQRRLWVIDNAVNLVLKDFSKIILQIHCNQSLIILTMDCYGIITLYFGVLKSQNALVYKMVYYLDKHFNCFFAKNRFKRTSNDMYFILYVDIYKVL
jgi:hypothetical protein